MRIVLDIIKSIYRKVVPLFLRESAPIRALKTLLPLDVQHNLVYDSQYYAALVEGPAVRSAETISYWILKDLMPQNVVDVGCGTGALLEALRKKGCEVFGLEHSEAALNYYCRIRGLDVLNFDLETSVFEDNRTFDVAISMEVAEHLPEKSADRFIDLLTRLSGTIVFTAAPPGQKGTDHVNEQPPSYWKSKFRQHGFEYDQEISQRWHESWKTAGDVEPCYFRNLMIFKKIQQT